MNGRRALAVSVHDTSPLTREATERMLHDLAGVGIGATSLLVVPDHHHKADIDKDPAFLAWLREKQLAGHEIILHGFYHRREPREDDGAGRRLVTDTTLRARGNFTILATRRRVGGWKTDAKC